MRKYKWIASFGIVTFQGRRKIGEKVIKKRMTKSDFALLDVLLK